jgi:siderophore synthetase component
MNVNATTDSSDGGLRVKLVEPDPGTGHGRIQIIELRQEEHARYYVTVRYRSGQKRIDYKTYDRMKNTVFEFEALPNDVTDITIVAVPAD